MESDKINITEPVAEQIKAFDPSDRNLIAGVLALLKDADWRETHKVNFGLIDGKQTWAIAEARVTIAFVEESDGTFTVHFVNMRSRFRPSWL
ncbi:MAG TPA: hypothetical protein VEG28_05365 [Dehalococcoidia bacterium]|nr:hypothetical protein [Dehalococcoidia bacterium]